LGKSFCFSPEADAHSTYLSLAVNSLLKIKSKKATKWSLFNLFVYLLLITITVHLCLTQSVSFSRLFLRLIHRPSM
ncbi:hypothetical protein, partial [Alteromonas genovensis]|uniref:hypothetical protein n=1 Tax=Alteromonas genovensis TaxID=471225 RepID=UPI002FE31F38